MDGAGLLGLLDEGRQVDAVLARFFTLPKNPAQTTVLRRFT